MATEDQYKERGGDRRKDDQRDKREAGYKGPERRTGERRREKISDS